MTQGTSKNTLAQTKTENGDQPSLSEAFQPVVIKDPAIRERYEAFQAQREAAASAKYGRFNADTHRAMKAILSY